MTINHKPDARRYFSVIVGAGCNAACPFCIAPPLMKNAAAMPTDALAEAAAFAHSNGSQVASISGGGEPLMLERTSPESWASLLQAIEPFAKRDLHSNFSIQPRLPLSASFTHLTASLWKDRQTTHAYLGRDFHDRIVAQLASTDMPLRLSAVIGNDWCTGPGDIANYLQLAKDLGASQVTLREMQSAPHADEQWMQERWLAAETVQGWLAELGELKAQPTVRETPIYVAGDIEVCVYRYAPDGEDNDFYYFRPDTNGHYDLFTDYDNDHYRVSGWRG